MPAQVCRSCHYIHNLLVSLHSMFTWCACRNHIQSKLEFNRSKFYNVGTTLYMNSGKRGLIDILNMIRSIKWISPFFRDELYFISMMFILFVYFHFIAYFSWFLKEMVRKLSNILGPLGLSLPWINLVYKDNNGGLSNFSELHK